MIVLYLIIPLLFIAFIVLLFAAKNPDWFYVWWILRPIFNRKRLNKLCRCCHYLHKSCGLEEKECLELIRETAYAEIEDGKTVEELEWAILS